MTLPWIVALAALIFLVLWQSGLLEGIRGPNQAERRQLPPKRQADSSRLEVFEDFLRQIKDNDESSPKDPRRPGGPA